MNMQLFESFRRVDVYAFAMVMWETTRRCMTHDGVEDFALPFHEMVSLLLVLAMVMWETTRHCMTHDGVEDFVLPFHEMVPKSTRHGHV